LKKRSRSESEPLLRRKETVVVAEEAAIQGGMITKEGRRKKIKAIAATPESRVRAEGGMKSGQISATILKREIIREEEGIRIATKEEIRTTDQRIIEIKRREPVIQMIKTVLAESLTMIRKEEAMTNPGVVERPGRSCQRA